MSSRVVIAVFLSVGLIACAALPPNFTMYPQPLTSGQSVDQKTAIVLIGISGPGAVDYLQFNHGSLPAINVRFPPRGDSVVAVPMPVGIKQLTLSTITLAGRPGSYVGNIAVGFIPVHTPRIDIDKPGVYYLATLDTSKPGAYSMSPVASQLRSLKSSLGQTLSGRDPINFQWPREQ